MFKKIVVICLLLPVFMGCGKKEPGTDNKPNILLITIDTLRRDHLSCYGYPRHTTPFIDSLAQEGIRFEHTLTPIPITSGSHASILTSLHTVTHKVNFNGLSLNEKFKTIAEVLQKNGYYTIGTIATYILKAKYHFSQGFTSFSDS